MTIKTRTTTTVTTKVRREILRKDLGLLLGLPEHATVFVEVPGGGDWSNCDLEIDDRRPLIVTFQTVEDKSDES